MKSSYEITAVFAVTLVKEGFVLVHDKDKPAPTMFKNPGGMIELGETPLQALKRELEREECVGLRIDDIQELLVIDNHKKQYSVLFYFVSAKNISVADITMGGEIDILKTATRKELETMISYGEIVPQHAAAIMNAIEKFS